MSTRIPPIAHSFDLKFCGDCPNGHVILLAKDGSPIAQFTISAVQAEKIAKTIRENDPNFREEIP
jgi:hypothetical protein